LLALARPGSFMLRRRQRTLLTASLVVFIGVLSLPGEIVGAVLPQDWVPIWLEVAEGAITVALLAATGIALWLLRGCSQAATSPQRAASAHARSGNNLLNNLPAHQIDDTPGP
jgi:hypothetical protein